jgi:hypothetical protein
MAPSTVRRHFPTFVAWYYRLPLLITAMGRVFPNVRLPRVRFTVQRMIIAVAIVGTGLGLIERRLRALARAEHHLSQVVSQGWACSRDGSYRFYVDGQGMPATARQVRNSAWHHELYSKYRLAANYPWLPIEPDPPEPE